jgi:ribonuclease P protein subunit POP4
MRRKINLTLQKINNILQHELIGLEVEVMDVSNPSIIDLVGFIYDETKNTFTIKNSKLNVIAKKNATFKFCIDKEAVKIDGEALIGRPEDRIKKKIWRKW